MQSRFVSYLRVSTVQQGRSGLGLDAQRAAVSAYRNGRGDLLAEFVEVETGKGADALDRRPKLREALQACKKARAVLLIARLDRLARNVHFVTGLIESGCDFVAVDMPHANKFMLQVHAVMGEHERDMIAARTRAALAAAKARGVVLGRAGWANLRPNLEARQDAAQAFAERLRPAFEEMRARGLTQRAMVAELNAIGVPTPRGGCWRLAQVQRTLSRLTEVTA